MVPVRILHCHSTFSLGGKEVRTEVVDHRIVGGGRAFDLTQALADELGVQGRETIRWRFAE